MEMTYFPLETDFWIAFEQFNVLCGPYFKWNRTKARKHHEDIFNIRIESGETYFKKQVDSFSSVEKLSMSSMGKMLYTVISLNPSLATKLQQTLNDQLAETRASVHQIFG